MATPTTIHDLPNEILGQILASPCLEDGLYRIQNVCQRWHDVVDEAVGLHIFITTAYQSVKVMTPGSSLTHSDFDIIGKVGVRSLLLDLDSSPSSINMPLPQFKYPHLVNRISITGSLELEMFAKLLKTTFNLVALELNVAVLDQLNSTDILQLKLDYLKILKIQKCDAVGLGLPNLHGLLLQNTFPSLSSLDVRFPIKDWDDFSTMNVLLSFLKRHLQLKVLFILMGTPDNFSVSRNHQGKMYPSSSLELIKGLEKEPIFLSTLEIDVAGFRSGYPHLELWKDFILTQRKLKSLTQRLGWFRIDNVERICLNNKDTLEYIHLYKLAATRDLVTLDCAMFQDMQNLQTLHTFGCDSIKRGNALPHNLTTLFLTGTVHAGDAEYILLELPHLKFVSFRGACGDHREGYGVSIDILKQFILQRRVKRLIIDKFSLSEAYPAEGLHNQDPGNPKMLKKLDHAVHPYGTYIDWELNCDSYYKNKID